jgi:cupin fold WbuC family metalloprotein
MIHFRRLNSEVLFTQKSFTELSQTDIQLLKDNAEENHRKRIRICTHRDEDDKLHEMIIVHKKGAYVRPHKHLNKSEAVHIIEGNVDVVIFDENGNITNVIKMGDYRSGSVFYCRMSEPLYHTLLIHSETLVFHEITCGPFNRGDTVFASWSPDETDISSTSNFLKRITELAEIF